MAMTQTDEDTLRDRILAGVLFGVLLGGFFGVAWCLELITEGEAIIRSLAAIPISAAGGAVSGLVMALLYPLMSSSTGAIVGSVISLFPYFLLLLAAADGWELGRGQLAVSAVMAVIFGVVLGLVIIRSREEEEKDGRPGEGESRARWRSEVLGWLERDVCACCGYPTLDASSTERQACRLCDWEAGADEASYSLEDARRNFRRHWTMYDLEQPESWVAPPTLEEIAPKREPIELYEALRAEPDEWTSLTDRLLKAERELDRLVLRRAGA